MHSSVKRMISIYDIPEDVAKKVSEVLQNDLREYESLDQDFGAGTEAAIQQLISVLQPAAGSGAADSQQ